jgi:hypothetical protein
VFFLNLSSVFEEVWQVVGQVLFVSGLSGFNLKAGTYKVKAFACIRCLLVRLGSLEFILAGKIVDWSSSITPEVPSTLQAFASSAELNQLSLLLSEGFSLKVIVYTSRLNSRNDLTVVTRKSLA